MAEQKEINSIDNLFRQAFDQMPEGSGATGWDKPSDRVWSNVQEQLPKPNAPARYGTRLVVALVVVAAAGMLYWLSGTTAPVVEPVQAPVLQPVVIPSPAAATAPIPATPSAPAATRPTVRPKNTPTQAPVRQAPTQPNFHNHTEESTDRPATDGHSRLLPGSKEAPPNTTERRRRSPLHAPLKPLPQVKPVVKTSG